MFQWAHHLATMLLKTLHNYFYLNRIIVNFSLMYSKQIKNPISTLRTGYDITFFFWPPSDFPRCLYLHFIAFRALVIPLKRLSRLEIQWSVACNAMFHQKKNHLNKKKIKIKIFATFRLPSGSSDRILCVLWIKWAKHIRLVIINISTDRDTEWNEIWFGRYLHCE